MNTTGKRWVRFWLLLTMAIACWGLFFASPIHPQDTTPLETECVVMASASSTIVPATLTPQEYCKVLMALVGNEWLKAAKLEATILAVNDHDVRLAAAEATIAQLQADLALLQTQTSLQPQIDAINTKLADMAAVL